MRLDSFSIETNLVRSTKAINDRKVEKYLEVVSPSLSRYRLNQKMPVSWVKNKYLKEDFLIISNEKYSYKTEKKIATAEWTGYYRINKNPGDELFLGLATVLIPVNGELFVSIGTSLTDDADIWWKTQYKIKLNNSMGYYFANTSSTSEWYSSNTWWCM